MRHLLALLLALSSQTFQSASNSYAQDGLHGKGHVENHDWYKDLMRPDTKSSCCNNDDCRPTSDRVVNGQLQVLVDGEWTNVPRDKILNRPSPDMGTHVCAPKTNKKEKTLYCVILGLGA